MCGALGLIVDKLNPAYCIDVAREQFIDYRFRRYLAKNSTPVREVSWLYCQGDEATSWCKVFFKLLTLKYHAIYLNNAKQHSYCCATRLLLSLLMLSGCAQFFRER
jgi:hypothetical protein